MQDKTKHEPNDSLWQARKRSGLAQKNVAYFLGQKSTKHISLYEAGQMPTLLTALKLEVIYETPIRLLFHNLYRRVVWQIREQALKHSDTFVKGSFDLSGLEKRLKHGDYCTYSELVKVPNLPPVEREKIREHLIHLSTTLSEDRS